MLVVSFGTGLVAFKVVDVGTVVLRAESLVSAGVILLFRASDVGRAVASWVVLGIVGSIVGMVRVVGFDGTCGFGFFAAMMAAALRFVNEAVASDCGG
jgi:hypothetical protein